MNQQILNDIQPLAKIGAFSHSIPEAATGVRTAQSELDQLTQEQLRLKLEISAGKSNYPIP